MTTITAKELRDNLDRIVQRARAGETIKVTYRNKPAFVIRPESSSKPEDKLAGLRAFDAAPKRPSPFDSTKSIKELYRESIAHKHGL